MKTAIRSATSFFVFAGTCAVCMQGCRTAEPTANPPSTLSVAHNLTYSPDNVIAHACARLGADQVEVDEIQIVRPKVFGLDELNAVVYGNYYVIEDEYRHIPQIYPLILRTDDGGRTWLQVLDPVSERASNLVELRFLDKDHGWMAWEHDIEGPAFGMLFTNSRGYTWESSTFNIPTPLAYLEGWSFSSPWNGECIVVPDYDDIPFEGDESRTVAFWKLRTEDGGRNWNIAKAIAEDALRKPAGEALPVCAWMPNSPRWRIEEREGGFRILTQTEEGKWETVLTLPRIPYHVGR